MDPTARNQAVQPSLLREVDLNKPVSRRYDLGMDDFVKSEAFEKRKSFSLKRTTVGAATKGAPTKRRCLAENCVINVNVGGQAPKLNN